MYLMTLAYLRSLKQLIQHAMKVSAVLWLVATQYVSLCHKREGINDVEVI